MNLSNVTIGHLKSLAEQLSAEQHTRLQYTKARIPTGGPKGSLKSKANSLSHELDTQQYYKDEGVVEFIKYLEGRL